MKAFRPPRGGLWIAAAALLPVELAALYYLGGWYLRSFVVLFLAQAALYVFAAWCLIQGPRREAAAERRAVIAVLIVAALLRGIAFFAPPALSTDAFRYVWDGRVQAAGVNPYRYVPADPALTALRDEDIYSNINRADYAHTIYPPTAQLFFLAVERISDSLSGMKLAMLACDGLSLACLLALLRSCGMPPSRVLLYAWHPLPIWEFAGSGHVDALAIALLLLALLLAVRHAPAWAGAALAGATLVKYYPLVALPALYRRWDWRMPAAFVATAFVLYLPYLALGTAVFGFMPGYADEEGLRSGDGFFLWSLLQTHWQMPRAGLHYYLPVALLVMLGLGLWLQLRRNIAPWAGALLLASAFTLLASPHNAWYFAWLIPFLCFRFSLAHVWLTATCVLIYILPLNLTTQALMYGPFLVLLAVQAWQFNSPRTPERFDATQARSRAVV
jgi:hypothetical protein